MKYEKSCYRFVFNCDPNYVKRTIDEYLQANNYKFVQKKNATYFLHNDLMQGKRFFEYFFQGNMVIIYVYLNSYKHPWPLDDAYYGSIPKQAYKEALIPLFAALDKLGSPDPYMMNMGGQQMYNGQNPYAQNSSTLQSFVDNNRKQKDNLAMLSLFFSFIILVMAFVGMFIYGIIMSVAVINMALLGLKSNKKGFAIAGLVITVISIVVLIMRMMSYQFSLF